MKIKRLNFLGFPVDNVSLGDISTFTKNAIEENSCHYIAVNNANKMYLSRSNPDINKYLNQASIVVPENAINIGMWLLRKPLKEKNIGGIHIMEMLEEYGPAL